MILGKIQQLFDGFFAGIRFYWDIMDPGFQGRVKEFQPIAAHVKDERFAEQYMFQAKTSCNSSKIKEVLVTTVFFEGDLLRWRSVESILKRESFIVGFRSKFWSKLIVS